MATATQIKYGTNAANASLDTGHIAYIDQTIVTNIKYMSIMASQLLRSPNCMGVNKMLKNRFSQKGIATDNPILPFRNITKTYRFTANIIGYKIDQTVPKTDSCGAQDGLFKDLYQLVVSMN